MSTNEINDTANITVEKVVATTKFEAVTEFSC